MEQRSNVFMAHKILYVTYGLLPILAGLDKYFYFLANWPMYLNMAIPNAIGISVDQITMIVGVIEIAAGLLVFFRPKLGGYVVSAWLLLISVNLVSMGSHLVPGCVSPMASYDIAVRDVGLAVGAYALALLS